MSYKPVYSHTPISDDKTYAVLARWNAKAAPVEKMVGSYDECSDYIDRNESPDNPEQYSLVEVVSA